MNIADANSTTLSRQITVTLVMGWFEGVRAYRLGKKVDLRLCLIFGMFLTFLRFCAVVCIACTGGFALCTDTSALASHGLNRNQASYAHQVVGGNGYPPPRRFN
jgi:hypothetical protein